MDHETIDDALLLATKGYPIGEIIVTLNEEQDPQVSMFVLDDDMQLLTVKYDVDGAIEFMVEELDSVLFHRSNLELIAKMQTLAARHWKQIQQFWNGDAARWEGFEHLLTKPNDRWKMIALDADNDN